MYRKPHGFRALSADLRHKEIVVCIVQTCYFYSHMKRALLIILCSCSLSGLNAQMRQLASFRIALPDSSGRQFFNRNDLHKYIVEFEQEKPVSVTMYKNTGMYDNADSVADEFYDLEFEGDKYLIKKKYEHINIPSLSVLDMSYWAAIGNIQHFKVRYEVPKAVVFKDSSAYLFYYYWNDPGVKYSTSINTRCRWLKS